MADKKFIHSGVHLPVRNLRETLDYYRDRLGFSDEWTFGAKDGGIKRDDLDLLFSEDPHHTNLINFNGKRLPLLWFVENIDAIYQEFKDRKIVIEDPLRDHPYGLREFAFLDINGYYVRVAQSIQ
jgi:catechol 2,3-dioxygenase-like lactoylglutathione lyase family enzyme